MRRPVRIAECCAQRRVGRWIAIVAVDVAKPRLELREGLGFEPAVLRHTVASPRAHLLEVPAGLGHADHGHLEAAATCYRLQGGEDLLVGEIAGGAEEYECVGACGRHDFFSTWPPNSNRIAESRRS